MYAGTEQEVLWSMVDYYRATALHKCAGLSDGQLRAASAPPSRLTPLGILRHLTCAERYWFGRVFEGELDAPLPYLREDLPDADLFDLDSVPVETVVANYLAACDASRAIARRHSLDEMAKVSRRGVTVNLRYVATHMVDEYARHCGHLDLLREAIDGAVGS